MKNKTADNDISNPSTTVQTADLLEAHVGEKKEDIAQSAAHAASTGGPADLARFALPQGFESLERTKKLMTKVPVRKPSQHAFVRTREGVYFDAIVFKTKVEVSEDYYLVDRALHAELQDEVVAMRLYLVCDRSGSVFVWPVRMPGPDGRLDSWSASAHTAAGVGTKSWIRVKANMSLGQYDVHEALGNLPDPEWPDKEFRDIVLIAFRDHIIDSLDHAALRRLRGEL